MILHDISSTKKNLLMKKKISMKIKQAIAPKIAPTHQVKSLTQTLIKYPQYQIKNSIIKIKKISLN